MSTRSSGLTSQTKIVLLVLMTGVAAYSGFEAMLYVFLLDMQMEVGASTAELGWVISGILVTAAVALPVVGRLADVRDKRVVVFGILTLTAIGMALTAWATSIGPLIMGQALQGIGFGLLPLTIGMARDHMPAEMMKRTTGVIIGVQTLFAGIGLLISGPVADSLSYRTVYWMACAALVITLIAAVIVFPKFPPPVQGRVDWLGAALLSGGLLVILVSVTRAPAQGWTAPETLGGLAAGVILLAIFSVVENHVEVPLLDFRMGGRTVLTVTAIGVLAGYVYVAGLNTIPYIIQTPPITEYGMGKEATIVGFVLMPYAIAGALVAPLTVWMEERIGQRAVFAISGLFMAASAIVIIVMSAESRISLLVCSAILAGIGIVMGFTQLMNTASTAVPPDRVSSVTSLVYVARPAGGALGAQVTASILASNLIAGTPFSTWSGYTTVYWVTAGVALGAAILGLTLPLRSRDKDTVSAYAVPTK